QALRNDVQVTLTVLSVDQENDPDLASLWAASCALSISNIPWNGPITGMRIGRINNEWVANPTYAAREKSEFELFVVGNERGVIMIELEGDQVEEAVVADAVKYAQKHWGSVLTLINDMTKEVGQEKLVLGD